MSLVSLSLSIFLVSSLSCSLHLIPCLCLAHSLSQTASLSRLLSISGRSIITVTGKFQNPNLIIAGTDLGFIIFILGLFNRTCLLGRRINCHSNLILYKIGFVCCIFLVILWRLCLCRKVICIPKELAIPTLLTRLRRRQNPLLWRLRRRLMDRKILASPKVLFQFMSCFCMLALIPISIARV